MLVGLNPCRQCAIVAPLPQIAKLPQKVTKKWFQDLWSHLSRYIALFWMRVTFCHLEMIRVDV